MPFLGMLLGSPAAAPVDGKGMHGKGSADEGLDYLSSGEKQAG